MSLAIHFTPKSMTAEQFDRVWQRLDEAGESNPRGRLYHICFGDRNALEVFDVWNSQESFDRFGRILMPILQEQGIDLGTPRFHEVYFAAAGSELAGETI